MNQSPVALQRAASAALFFVFLLISTLATAQMRQMHLGDDEESQIFSVQFVSPSKGFITTTDYIGVTADSGRTFTKLPITMANTNFGALPPVDYFEIKGIKVFTEQTMLVYGHYYNAPAILRSTDGGQTFRLVAYSANFGYQNFIRAMTFFDNMTGYAVDINSIYKTIDGGVTWSITTMSMLYFSSVDVIDANTVFITSNDYRGNRILKSINGGLSWSPLTLPESQGAGNLSSATFYDVNNGWAVFDGQRLYRWSGRISQQRLFWYGQGHHHCSRRDADHGAGPDRHWYRAHLCAEPDNRENNAFNYSIHTNVRRQYRPVAYQL